jgi:hypothetical protein
VALEYAKMPAFSTISATEAKKKISSLPKEEVKPFIEGLTLYSNYAHGTHVSGIALAGNPAGRVLVIRVDWPTQMIPPPPNGIIIFGYRICVSTRVNVWMQALDTLAVNDGLGHLSRLLSVGVPGPLNFDG